MLVARAAVRLRLPSLAERFEPFGPAGPHAARFWDVRAKLGRFAVLSTSRGVRLLVGCGGEDEGPTGGGSGVGQAASGGAAGNESLGVGGQAGRVRSRPAAAQAAPRLGTRAKARLAAEARRGWPVTAEGRPRRGGAATGGAYGMAGTAGEGGSAGAAGSAGAVLCDEPSALTAPATG